jgi:hypothetical protein
VIRDASFLLLRWLGEVFGRWNEWDILFDEVLRKRQMLGRCRSNFHSVIHHSSLLVPSGLVSVPVWGGFWASPVWAGPGAVPVWIGFEAFPFPFPLAGRRVRDSRAAFPFDACWLGRSRSSSACDADIRSDGLNLIRPLIIGRRRLNAGSQDSLK